MNRKILCVIAFALCGVMTAFAGKPQWIAGVVFEKGTLHGVPFATLELTDDATGELAYVAMTDQGGWYDLGNVETGKVYRMVVSAAGYETLSKKIKPEPIAIPGNAWLGVALVADPAAEVDIPVTRWSPNELKPAEQTLEALIASVPGIVYEEGFLSDVDGGSVAFMVGGNVTTMRMFETLRDQFASFHVTYVAYYDLRAVPGSAYAGVLSVGLAEVDDASATLPQEAVGESTGWDFR